MCENFFLLCMSFFIRISCLFTTGIQKCFIWIWAIYVHVNEAISQVMGQKLVQTNHTSAEKKENNDIKCFFFFTFSSVARYHIIRNVHLCHPYDGKQASLLSVELFGCQLSVCCAKLTAFNFTAFYLNLHIYLYK